MRLGGGKWEEIREKRDEAEEREFSRVFILEPLASTYAAGNKKKSWGGGGGGGGGGFLCFPLP